jgi:hypothetical protein
MHKHKHNPGAGCMGGLGTLIPPNNGNDIKGGNNGASGVLVDWDRRARPAAMVSSLLQQQCPD